VRLLYVLDCSDADALADFWAAALGFRRGRFHPPYVRLRDPADRWPNLLLQQVPEPKTVKNRMHLDIQTTDLPAEVERLRALGAVILVPAHDDAGFGTAVLADPQGNEFCVIQPPEGSYDHRQILAGQTPSAQTPSGQTRSGQTPPPEPAAE
jgi:predicted enzyme related to lactoylglutathione lyase